VVVAAAVEPAAVAARAAEAADSNGWRSHSSDYWLLIERADPRILAQSRTGDQLIELGGGL
jgi:hypothetical protein